MLSAYIFCVLVGGGFLALSVFGDFLDGMDIDLDVDVDGEIDAGGGADVARLLSLRTIVYAMFGFGATGALLHAIWGGSSAGLTAVVAGVTGLASGAIISTVFRYLKRSDSGTALGARSFVGLTGEVSMEIAPDSAGTVNVLRGERRYSVRARLDSTSSDDGPLGPGQSVVVVGMADGIATVVPVDMKLLEE
ncbi:NfeD family protein [Candidatus Palauibacter sp.]|uniref:NfeD family protein n=1 Tax=Candidatus Palauibacter sp. TaxID=3101350 RepID=UPI003B51ED20